MGKKSNFKTIYKGSTRKDSVDCDITQYINDEKNYRTMAMTFHRAHNIKISRRTLGSGTKVIELLGERTCNGIREEVELIIFSDK
jgi:hypothetical protein